MHSAGSIKIRNSSEWQGLARWEWAVWLEGPSQELDRIESVEYVLHPTFPNPIRKISDRSTNFQLVGRGWGEFMIHAKVFFKDGSIQQLSHWLRLEAAGRSAAARSSLERKPAVFVSFSVADRALAAEAGKVLGSAGFEVLTEDSFNPDEPLERSIRWAISRVDAMLVLISGEPSRWMLEEIAEAQRQQTPIFPVLLGERTSPPEIISDIEAVRITNPADSRALTEAIKQELKRRMP